MICISPAKCALCGGYLIFPIKNFQVCGQPINPFWSAYVTAINQTTYHRVHIPNKNPRRPSQLGGSRPNGLLTPIITYFLYLFICIKHVLNQC